MRGAALHNVKLNRARLAVKIFTDEIFKLLSDARKILVSEIIRHSRTILVARKLKSLGLQYRVGHNN